MKIGVAFGRCLLFIRASPTKLYISILETGCHILRVFFPILSKLRLPNTPYVRILFCEFDHNISKEMERRRTLLNEVRSVRNYDGNYFEFRGKLFWGFNFQNGYPLEMLLLSCIG